jgi:hypothetical protein
MIVLQNNYPLTVVGMPKTIDNGVTFFFLIFLFLFLSMWSACP